MTKRDRLREIHGDENCHICGKPKAKQGASYCSYPHAMIPVENVAEGMWAWEREDRADGEQTPEKP